MTPAQRAGRILAEARARRDQLPAHIAAEQAAQPGDDVDAIRVRIEAQRSRPQ